MRSAAAPGATDRVLVVVDAENVRRSIWPNVSREELVERVRAWSEREGRDVVIVFDGPPPEDAPDLVGAPSADDRIVELARTIERPWWLVTSDRGLRERVGDRPERVLGGGSFVRTI
jgi:hypothetical protein